MAKTSNIQERLETFKDLKARGLGSTRTLHRLNSSGKLPPCIRLGGRVLFRSRHVDSWIQMGCPSRDEFETLDEKGVI